MAIDPNIALGYRGIEAPNPLTQYAQVAQIQNAQNQNALAQFQMRAAQRGEQDVESIRNALANVQYGTPDYDKALTGAFLKTGNVKGLQEYQKGQRETEKAGVELQLKNLELQRDIFGNLAQNPSDENIKAHLQDMLIQKRMTPQEAQGWQTKTATMDPTQRKTLFTDLAMKANERVGHEVSRMNNQATVGATIRGQNMTDARARENIEIARKRLEKDGTALDPAENAAISKAILDGRLDPNKVNGRNAKILATTLLANPNANILELGVSASGATAAERSLATQTAKMSTAANEANDMVAIVRDLSGKVDRTEFPTINAITNAVSKGTGGKEIVQLNASLNALVNSYARAISPTGQPTVSDKNHAREVINSAYSTGQIDAILDVMQQEMAIARKSAGTASTELKESRETARGRTAQTPIYATNGKDRIMSTDGGATWVPAK